MQGYAGKGPLSLVCRSRIRDASSSSPRKALCLEIPEQVRAGFGLKVTADADGLDLTATGTADQFNSALTVQQQQYMVPAVPARAGQPGRAATVIHGTTDEPLLPGSLGKFVLAVLGLTNYPTFSSTAVHVPALAKGVKPSAIQTGNLTPADFAKQYNLSPLYGQPEHRGHGVGELGRVGDVHHGLGQSGGGFSALERTPFYQQLVPSAHRFSAVEYLTPIDVESVAPGLAEPTAWLFNPAPEVQTGIGTGRATPDVSADADPFTGYELYFTFGDQPATTEDGWGGTSFVAPQLNGATTLIDSLLGHRVGFWNPLIYRLADGHGSPFTPLDSASTSNDNLYYTGTPGHRYNVGSGLGTPNLAALAGDFARR